MDPEDGQAFVKQLAHFVRTHEKALANALQLRRQPPRQALSSAAPAPPGGDGAPPPSPAIVRGHALPSTSGSLAAALSMGSFSSQSLRSVKLSLTPHHLFYLLSRFEELGIPVGPMNVRLENIHTDASPANYVSFLSQSQRSKAGRGSDRDSVHSVSSMRSVMSNMSSLWTSFGLGPAGSAARTEKAKAAVQADLKYLYSAFTKIPCLRLCPDRGSRLIAGYEEFPFDAAVPLIAFKNVSALEVCDVDFRQFYGWDRLAEQLKSLTVRRANVEDPADLLIHVVLDDMDKRRRRSSKNQPSPVLAWAAPSPTLHVGDVAKSNSAPGSPSPDDTTGLSASPRSADMVRAGSEGSKANPRPRPRSGSPVRPTSSRAATSLGHVRSGGSRRKRSGSASSRSSSRSGPARQGGSSSNLLASMALPSSKWRFLRHLSLADNSLTSLPAAGLAPLAEGLTSLDLSSNLFAQIPDCLATLSSLKALNLSNCMIDSLHSLARNPLPAITALNLRANRLVSIAGVERLLSLERVDLRDNKLADPTELARLTGIPNMRETWVANNPFTRSHGGYRVTIFNLFRGSPGYSDDLIIDAAGPGYGERRQLVERVAEPPTVPVVKPRPSERTVTTLVHPKLATVKQADGAGHEADQSRDRPAAVTQQSDGSVGSARRRRTPRRRVVELSRADSMPVASASPRSPDIAEGDPFASNGSAYGLSPADPSPPAASPSPPAAPPTRPPQRSSSQSQAQQPPRLDTVMAPPSIQASLPTPTNGKASKESQDWNISSEIYKKKIEALRNDVGNSWLTVLNDDGWDGQRTGSATSPAGDFSPASTIRPSPTTPRAGSQTIIGGNRTLG
ncbi:MAG: hypothetical protein M1832_002259 [Thelocarpon impressellum]|nr:MAG: hypothetical protein M1832_002259 [Thelocarpon impressellum]